MSKVIKVQKIPKPEAELNPDDLLASFCYYFPQYTFDQARKLPYKRIKKMLRVVRKEQAKHMLDLLEVVVAPHTKNGKGIKDVKQRLSAIINE